MTDLLVVAGPGPAGTVTAEVWPRVVAEIDVGTGRLVALGSTALVIADADLAVLEVLSSDAAADAVRRLTCAIGFAEVEAGVPEELCLLDRVRARLELAELHPRLAVPDDDPDLRRAAWLLMNARLPVERHDVEAAMMVHAVRDLVPRSAVADPPACAALRMPEDPDLPAVRHAAPHAVADPAMLPEVVILSPGAHLAYVQTKQRPQAFWRELELTMVIPMVEPERWDGWFDAYLVEPTHQHPVQQISRLRVLPAGLEARFRVPFADLSDLEVVVLPRHGSVTALSSVTTRAILLAELKVRSAVRLSQKHGDHRCEALRLLDDAAATFAEPNVAGLVPTDYLERVQRILSAVERGGFPSGLLGDHVA